jgi:hypothetical protein
MRGMNPATVGEAVGEDPIAVEAWGWLRSGRALGF